MRQLLQWKTGKLSPTTELRVNPTLGTLTPFPTTGILGDSWARAIWGADPRINPTIARGAETLPRTVRSHLAEWGQDEEFGVIPVGSHGPSGSGCPAAGLCFK